MAELTTFCKMISKNLLKFVRQLEQKKHRWRESLFVAEGTKVVGDLLRRYQPHLVFAIPEWKEAHPDIDVNEVTSDELRRLSFLQHPQKVLALFPIPKSTHGDERLEFGGLQLALDGIQDPGNLGTIIRIADWFGITTIYCSLDTVDVWNPKVIQATMGSIAHVNIIYMDLTQLLKKVPSDFPIYGTFLDGNDIYQQPLSSEGIIIMGNEGNGISEDVSRLVNHRLLIPTFHYGEKAESLNVAIATAITCSEFRRRFH